MFLKNSFYLKILKISLSPLTTLGYNWSSNSIIRLYTCNVTTTYLEKKNTTGSVKVISRQRCIHQVARQGTIPCRLFSVLLFASKYSVQL